MDEQLKIFIKRGQMMIGILIAVIAVFLLAQMGFQQKTLDLQNANQITVSGTGKVYVKPDVALVIFGVKTTGLTVASVTKNNTEQMNAIIEAVKALKIDEKDIQTTNYNLSPNYNYTQDRGQIFEGYILEQNIQVKIRDFTIIGDVLSQATAKGANLVGSLQFTIDDPEQFREQARASAIKQAKANAQNLAKESGMNLGKLVNVYEGYSPSPVMYNSKALGMGGAADSASIPTIQPGQQEIDVTINLTYQVK